MILRGVVVTDQGVQVVIPQPFIAGPYPEKFRITRELHARGFIPISGFSIVCKTDSTFYHPEFGWAMFDAASDNFILSRGIPVPVDVILLKPSPSLKHQLLGFRTV